MAVRISRFEERRLSPPPITIAGTYPINTTDDLIRIEAGATGTVALAIATGWTGPTTIANRKTDGTDSARRVRITMTGKTFEGDAYLDVDTGDTELRLVGNNITATGGGFVLAGPGGGANFPTTGLPTMAGTPSQGDAPTASRSNHVHPSDTSRLAVSAASTFGLSLLDDANAAAARTTLGLGSLAVNATENATDAQLRDRATHTGTQASSTIADLTEAVQDIVGAFFGAGANTSVTYNDAAGTITVAMTGSADPEAIRDAIGAAMVGVGNITVTVNDGADTITIGTTATINSTDASLRDRNTHTGTQALSTVTGLQTALDAKLDDSQATTFGLSLLDDTNAAAGRTTLGLGTAAVAASGDFAPVSHTQAISTITDLQTTLDAKVATRASHNITAAGTYVVQIGWSSIHILASATGSVILQFPFELNEWIGLVSYKTDETPTTNLVTIVPSSPIGGGTAKTITGFTDAVLTSNGRAVILIPSSTDIAVVGSAP